MNTEKITEKDIVQIKKVVELLNRFSITPTQENVEVALKYNFDNLQANLENAAIEHFQKLRSVFKK